MIKIFLILFTFEMVFADEEESYEKYIDLLPEEEKQEFLNRIARRIFEEIKSGDIPNQSHTEINDDQLDAHHAYVQDIIKEESKNYQKEKTADSDSNKTNDNDKEEHIDLTLNDNRREKRRNSDEGKQLDKSDLPYNVIPVKAVYDETNNHVQEPSILPRNDSHENVEVDKDIVLSSNTTEETNETEPVVDNSEFLSGHYTNLRKSLLNNDTKTTEIVDFGPISEYNSSTTDDNSKYEITKETTVNTLNSTFRDIDMRGTTQKVYAPIFNENSRYDDSDASKNISVTVTKKEITTNLETTSVISLLFNETESNNTATTQSVNDSSILVNDEINYDQKFQRSGSDFNKSIRYTRREITSTTPVTLVANAIKNMNDSIENRTESVITNINTTQIIYNNSKNIDEAVALKVKNKSETELLRQKSKILEKENTFPELNLIIHPKNEYEVYEVAAEKPPFASLSTEQPNYVPLYNYAPEYAYFKPHVRFEPNLIDLDQENYKNKVIARKRNRNNVNDFQKVTKEKRKHLFIRDNVPLSPSRHIIRSTFDGYNNRGPFKQYTRYPVKQNPQNMYGFLKPAHKKIKNRNFYYNPYDYLDMDYANPVNGLNILRSRARNRLNHKRFPNSDDDDHPIDLIHKSGTIKDHVGAIRHLLYLQKIFGYVPDVKGKRKSNLPKSYINTKINNEKRKEDELDNIAVDYYFGRVNSGEDFLGTTNTSKTKVKPKTKTERLLGDFEFNDSGDGINEIKFEDFFDAMLNVLEDIIRFENDALKQYAWLKTTVEIQVAIRKLLDLSNDLQRGENLNRKDLELFKYTLYLFKISKIDLENKMDEYSDSKVKRKKKYKGLLPKGKKIQKQKQAIILWRDFAKYIRNIEEIDLEYEKLNTFYDFKHFLNNLQTNLNDLHEAIKYIAIITTYKTQNWFKDLKAIYFDHASRKKIGQVILHLSLVSLIDRINDDASNGAHENYRTFINNNVEEVNKTRADFVFIFQVLKELQEL